jgi:hypothetical protein
MGGGDGQSINNALHVFKFIQTGRGFADHGHDVSTGIHDFTGDTSLMGQPVLYPILQVLGNIAFKYKNHRFSLPKIINKLKNIKNSNRQKQKTPEKNSPG